MPSSSRTVALKSNIRVRRKHHKVWSGCLTCKSRHVKCDEAKPECERCRKSNVVCGGYRTPQARIFESSKRSSRPDEARSSSPEPRSSESAEIVGDQRIIGVNLDPFAFDPTQTPNDSRIKQRALMDAFLTIWLPSGLLQDAGTALLARPVVPMSAWPSIAWKLAKDDDEGFVAQALLCLTLVVIAARTHDGVLRIEASRHYGLVLRQFQAKIGSLAQMRDPASRTQQLPFLLAGGFCFSQLEFLLQSWSNGDKHLSGLASILHACGSRSLQDTDSNSIAHDHCLLWSSCSVVHRRRTSNLHQLLVVSDENEHLTQHPPTPHLVDVAERLAGVLEDHDRSCSAEGHLDNLDHLQKLADVVTDIEAIRTILGPGDSSALSVSQYNQPLDAGDLAKAVQIGYASSFIIQSVVAGWDIISSELSFTGSLVPNIFATNRHLEIICKHHVQQLTRLITELANGNYGMVTASPVLFFLDSAWMGYAALATYSGSEISAAAVRFNAIGRYMAGIGYRPLREPWKAVLV